MKQQKRMMETQKENEGKKNRMTKKEAVERQRKNGGKKNGRKTKE